MLFIYLITFNTFYVYSNWKIGSQFSFEDCYESFTFPKIVLKLLHYNPSGPRFIIVRIQAIIDYRNMSKRNIKFEEKYDLKKIDGSCNSSLIFSTHGMKIDDMEIVLKIYLSHLYNIIICTRLYFIDGFNSDDYIFMDENSHFGIPAKIIYSNDPFMPKILLIDLIAIKFYLASLKIVKSSLCIITENNRQFITLPHYLDDISDGYIVGIRYKFENIEYPAFECDANNFYRYETNVFIFENFPNSTPFLNVIYVKSNATHSTLIESPISVYSINLFHVEFSKILPKNIKKLYLMKPKRSRSSLRGIPNLTLYKSNNQNTYHAKKSIKLEISRGVSRYETVTYLN